METLGNPEYVSGQVRCDPGLVQFMDMIDRHTEVIISLLRGNEFVLNSLVDAPPRWDISYGQRRADPTRIFVQRADVVAHADGILTLLFATLHLIRSRFPQAVVYQVAPPPPLEQGSPHLDPEKLRADNMGEAADLAGEYGVRPFHVRKKIYDVMHERLAALEFAFGEAPDIAPVSLDSDRWFDLLRPSIQQGGFEPVDELQADRASHLHCVRELFLGADCFIFTLGLTEAWYQVTSGVVFPSCPGTVAGDYDPVEHKFVKFRHHEVVRDLQWCVDFIKGLNPSMRWIFTVSPVALAATATPDNVLVATSASKAVLRAAVDDVCLTHDRCAYFPSYEICSSPASFGQCLDSDLRNISPRGVMLVMRVFGETFGGVPRSELGRAVPETSRPDGAPDISEAMRRAISAACDEAFNDPDHG